MKRLFAAAAVSALALIVVEFRAPAIPGEQRTTTAHAFDPDIRVDAVLHRACANCHSNETKLPWFGRSRPIAWLMLRDVQKGRERLNFSEEAAVSVNERKEIYQAVNDNSMPLKSYRVLHPEARISSADLAILEAWANR